MRSFSGRSPDEPHGWNRWDNYRAAHFGHIDRLLAQGFLVDDRLAISVVGLDLITIEGGHVCRHGFAVEVAKALEPDGQRVRTIECTYQASFAQPHRGIFRYDNAHGRPGHADAHHKHVYLPPGSPEPGIVEWIGHDRWPSLFAVVRELEDWWDAPGRLLPLDSLPTDVSPNG